VRTEADTNTYPRGIKISDEQMAAIKPQLTTHTFQRRMGPPDGLAVDRGRDGGGLAGQDPSGGSVIHASTALSPSA
jgi:hypothetical protein